MKKNNYIKNISELLNNNTIDKDDLNSIESIINDNYRSSIKLFYNYYFTSIVTILIWILIKNSLINEIKIFDIQVTNKNILLITLPVFSCGCYYLSITYILFNQFYDAGLKLIYKKKYKVIGDTEVIKLMVYPSIFEFEYLKSEIKKNSIWSSLYFLLITSFIIITPLLVLLYISFKIFCYYKLYFIVSSVICFLLIARILHNIIVLIRNII